MFVWLLDLYGGSLGSYLPIPLENKNITDLGRGIFKETPAVFISDFNFVWISCRRAKGDGEMGVFSKT